MTLLELMAVIVIIGIFVALATPGMATALADRHAARAADDITGIFRVARMRAVATGGAHMVRVAPSGTTLSFELRVAIGALGGPTSSCMTPSWTAADSQQVKLVDFGAASGSYSGRNITVKPLGGTSATQDYCFTPGGIPWWRSGGNWTRPNGTQVAQYEIYRTDTTGALVGVHRVVRMSPSGVPTIEAD